jgi:hypothetical protein
MITVIESMFGIAIATSVAAVVCYAMKRKELAQKFGLVAMITGVLAVALELYVRAVD